MSLEKRVEQVGKHAVEKLIFDKADGLAAVAQEEIGKTVS